MSRKPAALVAADLHLERGAWVSAPGVRGDSYFALEQIRDLCLDRSLPAILAGDLFDKNLPEALSVRAALNFCDAMERECLPVYFVQGQHDRSPELPWFSLHRHAVHLHRLHFNSGLGLKLYGVDWTRPDELQVELDDVPCDTDVLVMHQVWTDFMGENIGGEAYFRDVPHAACLVTGDYHRHLARAVQGAAGRDMLVLSPGSTCMQSLDEPEDKYVFVLYDDLSFESVPLLTRKVIRLKAETPDELDAAVASLTADALTDDRPGIPEALRGPVVHAKVKIGLADAHRRLTGAVGARGHLFLTVTGRQNVRPVVTRKEVAVRPSGGLMESLEAFDTDRPMTKKLAEAFLASHDPAAEVEVQEHKYLSPGPP